MIINTIQAALNSMVILPLTAGNKGPLHRHGDGNISITVIIIIWLSIMIVVIPGRFEINTKYNDISTEFIVYVVLCCNLCIGITGCVIIFLKIAIKGKESIATLTGITGVLKLRTVFLWIFLIGSMIDSISKVCRDIMCLHKYEFDDSDEQWKLNNITSNLTYNAFLFIFCVFEAILLTMFVGYRMISGTVITFSIMSLFGTNITVWLHAFNRIHGKDKYDKNTSSGLNDCHQNNSGHAMPITDFIYKTEAPILTTLLQFTLLSINLLVEMWTSSDSGLWSPFFGLPVNNIYERSLQSTGLEPFNDDNNGDTLEETCELIGSVSNNHEYLITSGKKKVHYFTTGFGIILGISVCTLCAIGSTHSFDGNVHFQTAFCAYDSIMVMVLYLSFFCMNSIMVETKRATFTARELIMLVGVFFAFQWHTYKFIAVILSYETKSLSYVIEPLISLATEYLQIVLILQLNRIDICFQTNLKYIRYLKACIGLSMMLVLGQWFMSSFIFVQYRPTQEILASGLGRDLWKFVKFVIYPVCVFYRFTIFFAYVNLYKKTST